MISKRWSALPQYLAPQKALTALAGWLANCRWVWLKNILIRYFINRYQVDIQLATLTDIADYPNFNSFFTRYLKPELRPIDSTPNSVVSPADGCISQLGQIHENALFQAKGFHFDLCHLLGGFTKHARTFQNGSFATIYLAPKDYHRVHMPVTGTLKETIFIPGQLFSVNQKTAQSVPHLFARNERLVAIFDTEIGEMAIILVGAMLVGSINTVWGATPSSRTIVSQDYSQQQITLTRGAECGHFKMGSTVIVLFQQNRVAWKENLKENSSVIMGTALASSYL